MSEHREAAERALANAQRNPVMSTEQLFAVAQVHVLLAIEQRLGELVDHRRLHALGQFERNSRLAPGSV